MEHDNLYDNLRNKKKIVILDDNKIVGFCVTEKEADAITDKFPKYQWDKTHVNIDHLPLLTLSNIASVIHSLD